MRRFCIDPRVADFPLSSVTDIIRSIVPLTCHTTAVVFTTRRRIGVASLPTLHLFRSLRGRHTVCFSWGCRPIAVFFSFEIQSRRTERAEADVTVAHVSTHPTRAGTSVGPGMGSGPAGTGPASRCDISRQQLMLSGSPTLFTHQGDDVRARLYVHRHKCVPATERGAGAKKCRRDLIPAYFAIEALSQCIDAPG